MNDELFTHDVFLSHSSKDRAVVRKIAARLRSDGVKVWFEEWEIRPGDSIPSKIEEGLARSRVLALYMSVNAFGSDWAQLESATLRFRDPLNKERRFLPLRLDEAPINGPLAQFHIAKWNPQSFEKEYIRILEACRPLAEIDELHIPKSAEQTSERNIRFNLHNRVYYSLNGIRDFQFSPDRRTAATAIGNILQLWNPETGLCWHRIAHFNEIICMRWSIDQSLLVFGSEDGVIVVWDARAKQRLRYLIGHERGVYGLSWTAGDQVLSCSRDNTLRLWDIKTGKCLRIFKGHLGEINCVASSDRHRTAISGSDDRTLRLWDLETGRCMRVLEGHADVVWTLALAEDQRRILSSSGESVRLWDMITGDYLGELQGHSGRVLKFAWSNDSRFALSGSMDSTVRLWDTRSGRCLRVLKGHKCGVRTVAWSTDGMRAFSGDISGEVREWQLSEAISDALTSSPTNTIGRTRTDQVQYSNAKVLIVGDTHAGKTGLAYRLANGMWKPSADSTVGAWSTQWKLKHDNSEPGVDREVWLWDFGGQSDQRLIHQLYMDHAAIILVLFNADQEEVLPGLHDWQAALRRCVKCEIRHFLVAGRVDAGFKASRAKLQAFAKEQGLAYHETSAKSGEGCEELRSAMIAGIPWELMEKRTSPRIFKLIKDEILKLRDEGQVLHTFKELRELLWRRLPAEPRFSDEILQTVIGLLDGPGVVTELDYGTYILLAPEWINAYAQAVIRTLRSAENDLGVLPLRSIAEGKLIYQSIGRDGIPVEMKRLPAVDERVVLGEMERQLEHRGLCLRQGDKLVFPSHCGRDRMAVTDHPSVFVSYAVNGFLDDIYATLAVKLADCESFQLKELWRDAADFATLSSDRQMGIKLTRETASAGEISVYFGKGVTQEEQVIFANYIHAHLGETCERAARLRHYVCPTCHTPKGNPQVLMERLLENKQAADTECDRCGARFPLWDSLEKKFASDAVRRQVEELQADDLAKLSTRRKAKLLVLDVGARITSANQKWIEIPGDEDDGIDMQVEFTDEDGNGIGKGLCLQLKAGNSHLTKRTDGAEIFTIKKQRWVQTWMNQPYPVMLVIGTFSEKGERATGKEKQVFAEVRWMEITSVLRRESSNGSKLVKQFEFKGERLNLTSVHRWREKVAASGV